MECNRDEAIHSRNIAEQKFLMHDLMGAKKFALKAQHLFPALEGLPQLLAVLDVYIVAEDKVDGEEANWYGILQTTAAADDATIRQQYRKLALVLHPDKNKAVGADGAFKLISQAWGILSDKRKKAEHDARRRQTVRYANGFCNFTNFSTRSWPQPRPAKSRPPCWVECPSCHNHVKRSGLDENDGSPCPVCHQTCVATNRTHEESNKLGGKSNPAPMPKKQPGYRVMDGTTSPCSTTAKADSSHMDGLAFERSGSDVPASSRVDWEKGHGNKGCNAKPAGDNVHDTSELYPAEAPRPSEGHGVGKSSSRHHQAWPNTSGSFAKVTSTHSPFNFQFHWGGHKNRTPSSHPPAAMRTTAEMVKNVYETVKRERIRAQKEARGKAMKERMEEEKEARRRELRERREWKRKKKEEKLRKQARTALHAKRAFDKLFARECKASLGERDTGLKASCVPEMEAPEAGTVNANLRDYHYNPAELADQ